MFCNTDACSVSLNEEQFETQTSANTNNGRDKTADVGRLLVS
jgi:hypothetical protein